MTLGSPEWRRGAVWSGAQLGIYRDLQDPEDAGHSRGRGRRDAWRLRCCLATAAVALAALLVSIALVDVAGSGSMVQLHRHSSQAAGSPAHRTQGATVTATPAVPRAAGGRPDDGAPEATTTTTTTEAEAEAEEPAERSGAVLLPRSSRHRSHPAHRRFRDGRSQQHPCSGDCDEGRQWESPAEGSPQEDHSAGLRSRHHKGGHRQDVRFPESGSGGESVQYAQLASYKFSGGPNSIQDVIRYLTEDQPDIRTHRTQHRGRPRQHVRFPEAGGPRATAVRLSGVYSMSRPGAQRHEGTSPGTEPETGGSRARLTVTLPPPPLNGHAYIADPFVNFRPEDPSQINLLASSGLRFALPARSLDKVSQWRFPPARRPSQSQSQSQPQLYTEVVYHPLGHRPPPRAQQQHNTRGAARPYSLMLDVYPLTAEGQTQFRPPAPRPRPAGAAPHMVVHLNLYPRASAGGGRRDPHDRSDEFDYAETDPTQEDVDSRKQNAVRDNTPEAFVSSPVVFCNKTMDVILRLKDLEKPLDRVSQGNQSDTKEVTDRWQGPSAQESLPLDPREASSDISGDEETDDQVEGDDGADYSVTQQLTTRREEEVGPPTNGHQSHGGPDAVDGSGDYDIALDSGPPRAEEDYVSAVGYFGGLESRYQTRGSDDLGDESDVDRSAGTQMTGPETVDGTQN